MNPAATKRRSSSYPARTARAASPKKLAELYLAERERIRESNQERPRGQRTSQALTAAADHVIHRLIELAAPEDPALREEFHLAVAATGSYGRQELCPHSDIDVAFIAADELSSDLDEAVRRLFLGLMEVFSHHVGQRVGYGYRTLADAETLDHQTQSALLDARFLGGDRSLFEDFVEAVRRHIWPGAYVRRKISERAESIQSNEATLYQIEPDVREGIGGLRDLHLAQWLATVALPSTRGDVWRQLVRLGVISRNNARRVAECREFLLCVRNWMHFEAGRHADILVRDRQERLAVALGFEDDERASRVERFMEQYYSLAVSANRIKDFVVERCLQERLGLSAQLACVGNDLYRADPDVNIASPAFLIDLFEQYQEHGLRPGPTMARLLEGGLGRCPPFSSDPQSAHHFVRLIRAPAGVHDTLSEMARVGALQKLLPPMAEAFIRVPMDMVHLHTIGYHSLEVVRALDNLRLSTKPQDDVMRQIWNGIDAPEELFLAALLHDVGKLERQSDHATTGASVAREVCQGLGMDKSSTERVATLVEHHMLMSETAQYRDLGLSDTMQQFVSVVDTPQLLRMLALLTVADMAATGILTDLKQGFVQELYERADALLESPAASTDSERAQRYGRRLARRLSGGRLTAEQIERYVSGMPVAYVLNTPPDLVALHIQMMEALQAGDPSVEIRPDERVGLTAVHLCTWEDPEPGLLARIAGTLYAHDVFVHGAQVATRSGEREVVLDSLWVDYQGRGVPPYKRVELEQDLLEVLRGADVEKILERHHRTLTEAIVPERITFNNELSDRHTVLELTTVDQPGLLYRIARAVARLGWDIHSARIGTVGDRAKDALYLTTVDGQKLTERNRVLRERFLGEFMRE